MLLAASCFLLLFLILQDCCSILLPVVVPEQQLQRWLSPPHNAVATIFASHMLLAVAATLAESLLLYFEHPFPILVFFVFFITTCCRASAEVMKPTSAMLSCTFQLEFLDSIQILVKFCTLIWNWVIWLEQIIVCLHPGFPLEPSGRAQNMLGK